MQDFKRLERDILEAVYENGPTLGPDAPATQVLMQKYPSEDEIEAVTVALQYLLEQRYLWPYFGVNGHEARSRGDTRGITPKGIERLRQLRHPQVHWICANWFPFSVAVFSATIGLTNIFVN